MTKQPKEKHLRLVKNPEQESAMNSPGADDLINPEDFKSITLKVSLVNSTARTEIRDGKRIFGLDAAKTKKEDATHAEDLSIQIAEYAEKGLTLEVPSAACASGHLVVITIVSDGAKPNVTFTSTGKVDAVEKLPSGRESVRVTFTQLDEGAWQQVLNIYSRRQEEILNFFKAVKDY